MIWLSIIDSVHAEKLASNVLQSVVDLLWSQLNAMNALLITDASREDNGDPAVPSSDEPGSKVPCEAETLCK